MINLKWILKFRLTERLPYLNLNLGWSIKGLLYLNMNGRYLRGFSTLGPETIFSISILNYGWPRGFSTSIFMKGIQRASLTWNHGWLRGLSFWILNCGWPRGFSTSILMKGNQRAFLPWNLERLRGFSISILNCRRLRDFSTSILMNGNQGASLPQNLGWFPVKDQNLGLDFKGWVLCCSIVLRCDLHLFLLGLNFFQF